MEFVLALTPEQRVFLAQFSGHYVAGRKAAGLW